MKRIVFDIEANGFLDTATVIHCLVGKDIDTGEITKFSAEKYRSGGQYFSQRSEVDMLSYLDSADVLIAQNGTTYDFPFREKMFDWVPDKDVEIVDTLIMSRVLNPDRPRVSGIKGGPHSVEAWGKRLGRWKPENEDWSVFTQHMLHRCTEDVEIQHLMYQMLLAEAECSEDGSIFDKKSYKGDVNWAEAMWLEHNSSRIMFNQEQNGCYFDKELATDYLSDLDNTIEKMRSIILEGVPKTPKVKGVEVRAPFKKNGDYTKMTLDWYPELELTPMVWGPFSRIEWHTLNLKSHVQVKDWLYSIGWVPDEWNYQKDPNGRIVQGPDGPVKTSPKITESSLEVLSSDLGKNFTLFSKSNHRRNQIQGWVSTCRDDHRIEARANPQGTPTARMKHIGVANVPKPNVYQNKKDKNDPRNGELIYYPEDQDVYFGTEMRSLFRAAPGKVLVGRDASGLELRCFAHYVGSEDLIEQILHGDIHTFNMKAAGLTDRNQAKTFIYAFLYGAGAKKLGSIVVPDADEDEQQIVGEGMKRKFLAANPKLEKLIKNVQKASSRGYLKGLDGRKLWMRRESGRIAKKKALNTLLQGAGSIIMTYARVWLDLEIQKKPWAKEAVKVIDYHDEETYEISEEYAEELKELMIQSVVEAGKHFNLRLPLAADARIGQTWAEIH